MLPSKEQDATTCPNSGCDQAKEVMRLSCAFHSLLGSHSPFFIVFLFPLMTEEKEKKEKRRKKMELNPFTEKSIDRQCHISWCKSNTSSMIAIACTGESVIKVIVFFFVYVSKLKKKMFES